MGKGWAGGEEAQSRFDIAMPDVGFRLTLGSPSIIVRT
jgi:hypothetical protein